MLQDFHPKQLRKQSVVNKSLRKMIFYFVEVDV